jgi:hypothetical protein
MASHDCFRVCANETNRQFIIAGKKICFSKIDCKRRHGGISGLTVFKKLEIDQLVTVF